MSSTEFEDEVVDVEPYEGDPDFETSPSRQHYGDELPSQDELKAGEALGDDLAVPEVPRA